MLSLCADCGRQMWPFAFALVVSGLTTFVTWLMLGLVELQLAQRGGLTFLAFLVISLLLWRYVSACLKRHCRH